MVWRFIFEDLDQHAALRNTATVRFGCATPNGGIELFSLKRQMRNEESYIIIIPKLLKSVNVPFITERFYYNDFHISIYPNTKSPSSFKFNSNIRERSLSVDHLVEVEAKEKKLCYPIFSSVTFSDAIRNVSPRKKNQILVAIENVNTQACTLLYLVIFIKYYDEIDIPDQYFVTYLDIDYFRIFLIGTYINIPSGNRMPFSVPSQTSFRVKFDERVRILQTSSVFRLKEKSYAPLNSQGNSLSPSSICERIEFESIVRRTQIAQRLIIDLAEMGFGVGRAAQECIWDLSMNIADTPFAKFAPFPFDSVPE